MPVCPPSSPFDQPAPIAAPALSQTPARIPTPDLWVSRARPTFLYVMYGLILWAIPMGIVAAFSPALAHNISKGMTEYLASLPDALYALFGTGYLGYTAARQWSKNRSQNQPPE